MMIGPSAPKGPPVPIDTAEDTGLRMATFASRRLRPIRIASRASGMPWPRILGEPQRAIAPMMSPPTTGMSMLVGPRAWSVGVAAAEERRPAYARFVMTLMSQSSAAAASAPRPPMTAAPIARSRTRRSVE